jgi:hypothetical protein
MRIKHFAGYGCVNATKVRKDKNANGDTVLVVRVSGNHEWGLLRGDVYDLKQWIVDRFDKAAKDLPWYAIDYSYNYGYDYDNAVEVCEYTFRYAA